MRCRAAASPAAHTRTSGSSRAAGDSDEGITRTRTGLDLIPLHYRARMGGQIEASRHMLHLDENPDLGAPRHRSQKHADGGQGRLVIGQQEAASCGLDVVSALRARDCSAIGCPCVIAGATASG